MAHPLKTCASHSRYFSDELDALFFENKQNKCLQLVGVLLQLKCDMIATYLKMQKCIAGGDISAFLRTLAIQLKLYERIIKKGIGGSR